MRFSPGLSAALTGYYVKSLLQGRKRFPFVLMLEPTHRCNLACTGCDRIRLYSKEHAPDLALGDCVKAVIESRAPVVTVTGGEPLLYGDLTQLLAELFRLKRHVYLCTNGLLAGAFVDSHRPHPRLTLNFHVDGLEEKHDRLSGKPGTFRTALEGLRAAKKKGFRVWTNTSVYKGTDATELIETFVLLKEAGVDGILFSPAFGYESVSDDIFLRREDAARIVRQIRPYLRGLPIASTPLYLDFLEGKEQMACMPWGSPTRNPFGWKSPCYLITDGYYGSFSELMERTRWEAYGTGGDGRCRDCMVHSGFEPTVMSESFSNPRKMLRMMRWNLR